MPSKQTDSRPQYELRVENFGKLAEAEVRIGDFTVLAGPNNTGKSFVSKLLYSVFSALDADLPREHLLRLVNSVTRSLTRDVTYLIDERVTEERLRRMAVEMRHVALAYSDDEIESLNAVLTQLNESACEIEEVVEKTIRQIEKNSDRGAQKLRDGLSKLRESHEQLTSALKGDRRAFSLVELRRRIKRALNMNFQVAELTSLARDEEKEIVVSIAELLRLTTRGDSVDFGENDTVPALPSGHQNVVYIESPVYWKLFDVLGGRRPSMLVRRPGRERLTGVPDYFYDLAQMITGKYTGEMAFADVHRELVGENAINGEVAMSESGDIVFKEAGRSFPLVTAAAGVANIGFLAMLIERKVIDDGTMLFIDEPEAHLHPAWQVVVAKALFQLAREGVRVVLATHSLEILKWLEVHLKENPGEGKHVALNRFPDPVFDDEDVETKLASIKYSLTKPFVSLYMRGI